ncbi:MAG: carbohydrate binding family 9 domain-containing protein [Bacteroidota bacterium]
MLRIKVLLFTVTLIIFYQSSIAQEVETLNGISKKVHYAERTTKPPTIDGRLDEDAWQKLPVATDFVERRPVNGQAAPDEFRTEARILYDDQAIYFGITMYDPDPDSIQKELTERDQIANDDFVSIRINGYRDGQQSSTFMVTAAGVQRDIQNSNNGNDNNWNAIWRSAVKITDFGWVLEVKIPYRELRFPEKQIQEWGLQIEREVRRIRTRYTWNYVEPLVLST